ncbi:terpene cyclase/mutase family protein [bacterium]|nr:terpene cyclase/mutase family protein [bacterium]
MKESYKLMLAAALASGREAPPAVEIPTFATAPVAAAVPVPAPGPLPVQVPGPLPVPVPVLSSEELLLEDPLEEMAIAVVRATPWWLLSLAFHALMLSCLPLLIFTCRFADDDGSTIAIGVAPPRSVKLDFGDRPRAVLEKTGLPESDVKLTEEPRIFFPSATGADHSESADGEDYALMKGDSTDALSWMRGLENGVKGRRPGEGSGVSDVLGLGGGSGGARRYGTRFGGRRDLVARGGGSQATESAVEAGLRWLARHQSANGSWSCEGFDHACARKDGSRGPCYAPGQDCYDVGVTSLAILAFLGAGHTPTNRSAYRDPETAKVMRFGDAVKNGLKWLLEQQEGDGAFGSACQKHLYNHVLATFALSEAYGMTNAVVYRVPAQKAVDYLEEAQNPGRGWQYQPKSGVSDTSMTGFCVMALKSAAISGLDVSEGAFSGARSFLVSVTDRRGVAGYFRAERMKVVFLGNDRWADHPTCTAVAMLSRMYMDQDRSAKDFEKGARLIAQDLPRCEEGREASVDYYYWYAGTLSVFQYDGPDGPLWSRWNEAMSSVLCSHQHERKDGCQDGSWDAKPDRWGVAGGRVYATAMNVLTLEVYYRFASIFGSTKPGK